MAGNEATGTILKVLTGVQSGVDVFLLDGDYTLGSGDDDDIQIFDVSLKPGHARLSIRPGKYAIAGAAGELRTKNGIVLGTQGELQEIEPLDIVSAGTSRFALGPRNGNWASIAETNDNNDGPANARRTRSVRPGGAAAEVSRWRSWHAALPVIAILLIVGGGVWLSSYAQADRGPSAAEIARNELQTVRSAVDGFDFGKALKVDQDVDGVIYVTGFVETPVERRAILSATRGLDIPARVRLQVLETMRSEIANLISEEKVPVDFDLSETGELTLSGTVLDAQKAARVAELVKERVPGLATVASQIRTAPSLLSEVKNLAARSQIEPLVLLRLDDELIEASGVLPTEKIDPWVGFLQAYSSQFADAIPLRSLVQLQNPDGTLIDAPAPSDKALLLGRSPQPTGDIPVDVTRLKAGSFQLTDVFVGQPKTGLAAPVGAGNGVGGFEGAQEAASPEASAAEAVSASRELLPGKAEGEAADAAGVAASAKRELNLQALLGSKPETAKPAPASPPAANAPAESGEAAAVKTSDQDASAAGGVTSTASIEGSSSSAEQAPADRARAAPARPIITSEPQLSLAGSGPGPDRVLGLGRSWSPSQPSPTRAAEASAILNDNRGPEDTTEVEAKDGQAKLPPVPSETPNIANQASAAAGPAELPPVPGETPNIANQASAEAGPAELPPVPGEIPNIANQASAEEEPAELLPLPGEPANLVKQASAEEGPAGEASQSSGSTDAAENEGAGPQEPSGEEKQAAEKDEPAEEPAPASNRSAGSADAATSMARRLIVLWQSGELPADDEGRRLLEGMNALQAGEVSSGNPSIDFDPIAERYAPLMTASRFGATRADPCWRGSKLSEETVAGALFWLDLLSVTRDISLTDLQADMQPAILDAALNPRLTEDCTTRDGRSTRSVYLYEIDRNPSFISFITRDLPPFALDIAGADIATGRYIKTRDGRKMREGAAPDATSRLAIVGELGVAVERSDGYSTVIFGQGVNWLVR